MRKNILKLMYLLFDFFSSICYNYYRKLRREQKKQIK
ncbi:hypothetical protein YTXLTZUM_CDS0179 [Enterococcus phage VRE9_3]